MRETHIHSEDGTRLYARFWEATGSESKCICIIHGLGEHSGRYIEAAEFFQTHGCAVLAIDLRGHGQSPGWRGYVKDYELLLQDVDAALGFAANKLPSSQIVLYGQSMGGNLVVNFTLRKRTGKHQTPDGLIVTSPMFRTAKRPPRWKEWLGRRLYNVLPWFSLWNGILPRYLSRDKAIGRKILKDRKCHPWLSARLGISLLDTGNWALENSSSLDRPMLLMHGEDDHVTSFEASREFADAADDHCQFVAWPGSRHELQHELNYEQVFEAMIEWLNRNLPDKN